MKFSIKLLLFFFGILGFLMLTTDVVLWAYYKKGLNGDGQPLDGSQGAIITKLKPFKALVVKMKEGRDLDVMLADSFEARYWGADWHYDESRRGDTLYLDLQVDDKVTIAVPAVDYIRLESNEIRLQVAGLEQSQLTVQTNHDCRFHLSDVKIKRLAYTGGRGNMISVAAGGYIDSLGLDLGKNGSLHANNTTIRQVVIAAENLKALNLSGVSTGASVQRIQKP